MKKTVYIFLCVALACCAAWPITQALTQHDGPSELESLIRMLGSKNAAEAERAAQALTLRGDAAPQLRKAMASADKDVAARAQAILAKLPPPGFKRARAWAAAGQVDLLFEFLAGLKKGEHEDECWNLFHTLMSDIPTRAQNQYPDLNVTFDFLQDPLFSRSMRHREILVAPAITWKERGKADSEGVYKWVRTKDFNVPSGNVSRCRIIATGKLKIGAQTNELSTSYVYAGEHADIASIFDSVLVCDGDVHVHHPAPTVLMSSVIIARGKVRFDCCANTGPRECFILAGDRVTFGNENVAEQCAIVEHERKPLGMMKFFEVADLGLHVIQNEKGIVVNTVDQKQLFGRAGVQMRDKILAVDDQKVSTYEAFRRSVRAKLISEESFALHIDRGGEKVKLSVAWK